MEIREVNKVLFDAGMAVGMCEKAQEAWNRTLTRQELIDLWYGNYDFALTNHFPSNELIQECFDRELLQINNILVDDKWSLLNPKKAMILGKSESNIRFNGYHVGQVWVRDSSSINVTVKNNADVTICVMDKARLMLTNYATTTRVLVMKYSKDATIEYDGIVKIVENYGYLNYAL